MRVSCVPDLNKTFLSFANCFLNLMGSIWDLINPYEQESETQISPSKERASPFKIGVFNSYAISHVCGAKLNLEPLSFLKSSFVSDVPCHFEAKGGGLFHSGNRYSY